MLHPIASADGIFLAHAPQPDGRPQTSVAPSARSPSRERLGYLPTLDGWRAIAILWVLNGHQKLYHFHQYDNGFLRYSADRGVQLFFALSGLIICSRLLSEEEHFGNISLKSFYVRRLFRIQPAAMLYLAVLLILSLVGVVPMFWQGMAGAALMVRGFWPGRDPDHAYWFTSHFWSLGVEEHFYLLLPGFLLLCKRHRLTILTVTVIALEFWRRYVRVHPAMQGGSWLWPLRTDVVLGGILLGSVFAVALTKDRFLLFARAYLRPWVALLYTALVFARLYTHSSRTDHALLITTYPVLIVATLLHPESLTGRLLEWQPLRFLGRISFSLYLWQQMFFNFDYPPEPGTFRSHVLLCLALAFACAIASYYLVERPMIRFGHRWSTRFDPPNPVAAW